MRKVLYPLFAVATLATGCATVESNTVTEEKEEVVYQTGSNIPRKHRAGAAEGVSAYDREALEKARQQTVPTVRPGLGGGSP